MIGRLILDWYITPYAVGLGMASLLAVRVAIVAFRHRDRPGGLALALTMLAVTEWAAAIIIEANAITLPIRVLWSKVAYIGTLSCGPLLLHFAAELTHHERILKPRSVRFLVWSIPVATLVLAFTNEYHGLIWSSFTFTDSSHRVLTYGHGPAFWVEVAHVYLILLTATIILIRGAVQFRHIHRAQSIAILLSMLPPWGLNIVYLVNPGLIAGRDWTPAAFAVTGAILWWSFRRLLLLDLMPVARDRVLESMQDGVVVLDVQGRIADINPAAERLIGRQRLIGREAAEIFAGWVGVSASPGSGSDMGRQLPKVLPHFGEFDLDEVSTVEWRMTPLVDRTRHTQGYLVILRDVTETRRAENALHLLNTTLEAQVSDRTAEILAEKERSDAILRSVSDGVLMTDHNLCTRYVNPAFSAMTGYGASEALGRPLAELIDAENQQILRPSEVGAEIRRHEVRVRRSDGRHLDAVLTVLPMQDTDSGTPGCVFTLHDIGQSRDLDRARKGLLDNISHQLRTPVTTLRLYTHLLHKADLLGQHTQNLNVMDEQISWLQHLIEDILEMASLDSGQAVGAWEPVSPSTIMDHLVARFESRADQAGLQFSASPLDPGLPSVSGDHIRLIQAISEIVDNAIRFTPPGGEVKLAADAFSEGGRDWVSFTIENTGPGIPLEEQHRVFDRFFRGSVAESGRIPGTGLGLNIAQAVARAHGGELRFESRVGRTVFRVQLPTA